MKRRDFIVLLGSVVGVWPIATRAQQAGAAKVGCFGLELVLLFRRAWSHFEKDFVSQVMLQARTSQSSFGTPRQDNNS